MHPLCGHVVVSGPDQCCADQAWESFWSTMESILTPALLHAINKPETMKGMYAAPVRSGSKGHVLGKSNDTRKKSTTQGAEIVLETWGIIEKDYCARCLFSELFESSNTDCARFLYS
eukprot:2127825-Rhodomonas_salina.2